MFQIKGYNIGYEAKRAFFNKTGLGNYSRTFLKEIFVQERDNRFFLFTPKQPDNYWGFDLLQNVKIIWPKNVWNKLLPSFWRSLWLGTIAKRYNIDLFHGLSQELPFDINFAKCATVVTIHDLIFLRFEESYKLIDIETYKRKAKFACENADHIIAISQQTKEDIIQFFGIAADKITVIYQDCSALYKSPIAQEELQMVQERYSLPSDFVLSVGALNFRKNNKTLIESLVHCQKNVNLVIAGDGNQRPKLEQLVADLGLQSRVQFLGFVPDICLKALYSLAQIYVYPSLFEGFGIPILESLHCNTPVITGTKGCFSEVGGKHAIYVDQTNPKSIAAAIDQLYLEPTRQMRLLQNADAHLSQFQSVATFPLVQEVYGNVLKARNLIKNHTSPSLTTLLITFNEENNIREYLKNFSFSDEIIVVDSYSTDNTIQILKNEFPHVKIFQRVFDNFTAQRNFAIDKASGDWIMFFDADERIDKDLQDEILATISQPNAKDCYFVRRYFYYHNKIIKYSGWKNDKAIRLFKNMGIKYDEKYLVHEQITSTKNMGVLKNRLNHYSMFNVEEYKRKLDHYAKLRAQEIFNNQENIGYLKRKLKPKFRFFKHYIIQLGFLDGKKGYIIAKLYEDYVRKRFVYLKEIENKVED